MNRIDKILVAQGFAQSRTQAQKLIAAGAVSTELHGQTIVLDKASAKYVDDIPLSVESITELSYVSRAGLKLESAFTELSSMGIFNNNTEEPSCSGDSALDVGQSTGGFTDFLLRAGVRKVVGIDVGHNQLAPKLREDSRVLCLEGINARDLPAQTLLKYSPLGYDWVVMDVSFISQTLILPHLSACLSEKGFLISLVKPQFEAGRSNIGKGGIVSSEQTYKQVEEKICRCVEQNGMAVRAYFKSGLKGADGNQEFFVVAENSN